MEFIDDYDLDIAYHLGEANLVTNALSWRWADVSAEKDSEELEGLIQTLHLNSLPKDQEPLDLCAVDQADLLTMIRIAQGNDENLNKVAQMIRPSTKHWTNDKTKYQTLNQNHSRLVQICEPYLINSFGWLI